MVIETISIAIYGIVLYRVISKRKLHKSMNVRDKARSDLYLAQLRLQSAPNTPGFKSSTAPEFAKNLHDDSSDDGIDAAEKGQAEAEWARRHHETFAPASTTTRTSHLFSQPPGLTFTQATPVLGHQEWSEQHQDHMEAAPGEQTYGAVPIPGAYGQTTS